MPAINNLTSDY